MVDFELALVRDVENWMCMYVQDRTDVGIPITFAKLRDRALKRFPISPRLFDESFTDQPLSRIWQLPIVKAGDRV